MTTRADILSQVARPSRWSQTRANGKFIFSFAKLSLSVVINENRVTAFGFRTNEDGTFSHFCYEFSTYEVDQESLRLGPTFLTDCQVINILKEPERLALFWRKKKTVHLSWPYNLVVTRTDHKVQISIRKAQDFGHHNVQWMVLDIDQLSWTPDYYDQSYLSSQAYSPAYSEHFVQSPYMESGSEGI